MECNGYNTFRGLFFRAWKDGYLESHKFREELGRKTKAYVMTIILGSVRHLLSWTAFWQSYRRLALMSRNMNNHDERYVVGELASLKE